MYLQSLLAEKTTREELLVTYNETNKAQQGIIQQKDTRINDLEHQQMALKAKCRDGNLRAESTALELSNMRICVAEAEREMKAAVALRDKLQQQSLAQESVIETLRDQLRHAHSQDTDWNAVVRDSGLTSREKNPDSEDMVLDVPGETLANEPDAVIIDNPPRDTFTVDQPTATELNITKDIHSPKAPTSVPPTATTTASDVLPKRKARTKPKGNVRSRSKSADTALHPLPNITGDGGKKSEASVGQKSSKGTKTATTSRPRRRSAAVQRHMITSLSEDSTSPVPPVQVKTKTAAVKGKTFRKTPRKPKGPSKSSAKPKAKAKKDVQDKAKAADDNHGNGDSAMSDSSAAEILDDKENQAPEDDWAIQLPSGGNRPPLAKRKTPSSETRQPGTPEVMPFRDITAATNNPPKPSRTGFRGKKSQTENTVQATVESPLDFLCDDAWGFNDD
ncbi:hypothetical protein SARC_06231 [Sphaeroforma arctica JP610]|uniref:Uncharacterized protein n=1 Tax=Sphaeroforma arctica JP610 TaxID=667725 RepID=A0A0L0FX81_9EUKA|nr:hypothetical protein SARC_06231 [Sphaeroforma arctica JP610]KNC81442.1 hypothetical protein SARC_06231 [Sphaeroforma arctica JP610]|eukprot:XP_014155344.1 hypothetical protein SARC_06231 [Sphaeroforma arctica JP610]